MNNYEYHESPGISATGLKIIHSKSPAHYLAYLTEPRAQSPAFFEGEVIHCAVLEPERFQREYCVAPKFDKRTTVGKEGWAQFQLDNPGRTALDPDLMDRAILIQHAIADHPVASKLLSGGKAEESVFTMMVDQQVRCRPDYIAPGYIVDLKTANDASESAFQRAAFNYGYHLQAAFYLDVCHLAGLPSSQFHFVVVEKTAPFAVQVFTASPAFIKAGRQAYRDALAVYAECNRTDTWPAYSTGNVQLDLPPWATRESGEEILSIEYAEESE